MMIERKTLLSASAIFFASIVFSLFISKAIAATVSHEYEFYSGPSTLPNITGMEGFDPESVGYTYRGSSSTTANFPSGSSDKKLVVVVRPGSIAYVDAVNDWFGTEFSVTHSVNTISPENIGSGSEPDGLYGTIGDGTDGGYLYLYYSGMGMVSSAKDVFIADVDLTPPLTTADPAGGLYTSELTVTLSCDDGSGSGCDQIYYTMDGSLPTISSFVYASPITISSSTLLRFFSTDLAGNTESVKTDRYVMDYSCPSDPAGVTAFSNDDGSIDISWIAPADYDLSGYNIYKDDVKINSQPLKSLSFFDNAIVIDETYIYRITSLDYAGNESSGATIMGTATVNAGVPPLSPAGIQLSDTGSGTSLSVSWLPNKEADLSYYSVYWGSASGIYTGSANAGADNSYEITELTAGERYFISLTATDMEGNESDKSTEGTETPTEMFSRPEPISSLDVSEGNSSLTLSWSPVPGISGYKVYIGEVDGLYGIPVRTGETSYTFENLENNKTYYVAAGTYNLSPESRYTLSSESTLVAGSGTPYDNDPPSVPSDVTANDSGTGETVIVKWGNVTDADLEGYLLTYQKEGDIDIDGAVAVVQANHYVVSGLAAGEVYTFNVYAYDLSGNFSASASDTATATVIGSPGDVIPPERPLFDATPGNGNVILNITSPPDEDVVLYHIYNLSAGKYMPIASTEGLAYEQSDGVENGMPLIFVVSAEDSSGNESAFSDPGFVVADELPGNILLEDDPPVLDRVDSYDIIKIANGYGKKIGHPDYNSNADLNADGIIDEKDMAILLPSHGKTKGL